METFVVKSRSGYKFLFRELNTCLFQTHRLVPKEVQGLSLFINFLFISIDEKNWFAESMFFVEVHWMEFVSHVKFRQLQTQR